MAMLMLLVTEWSPFSVGRVLAGPTDCPTLSMYGLSQQESKGRFGRTL